MVGQTGHITSSRMGFCRTLCRGIWPERNPPSHLHCRYWSASSYSVSMNTNHLLLIITAVTPPSIILGTCHLVVSLVLTIGDLVTLVSIFHLSRRILCSSKDLMQLMKN